MAASDQDPKNRLQRLIEEGGGKAEQIIRLSGELSGFGQLVKDLADASLPTIKPIPPSTTMDWTYPTDSWSYLNEQEDAILAHLSLMGPTGTASGGTAANSMTLFTKSEMVYLVPEDEQPEFLAASRGLSDVIDRAAEKGKVLSLLKRFGLDNARSGKKSPAELFETAWAAFEKPVTPNSPAVTSLLPMRESINETLAELLRLRPKQEPTRGPGAKVLSVCRQLAGNDIPKWVVQSLAERWEKLKDELSAAKAKKYDREEWADSLRKAGLFLTELLQSLDRPKMK